MSNQSRRKLVDQKAIALDRAEQEILHALRRDAPLDVHHARHWQGKGRRQPPVEADAHLDQPDQPGDAAAEWATEESAALRTAGRRCCRRHRVELMSCANIGAGGRTGADCGEGGASMYNVLPISLVELLRRHSSEGRTLVLVSRDALRVVL